MTETQAIYAFLEMFRSEVGFPKRMATEAYGSSHPPESPEGTWNLQKRVDMAQRPGVGLIPGLPPILRFSLERTKV